MLMVSGTFSHVPPVAQIDAMSDAPTPVENAPNAPMVQVWESAPMTISPGRTLPSLMT